MKYNQQHYKNVFNDPESVALLNDSVTSPSLLTLLEVGNKNRLYLTHKAPITTAADDIHKYFFIVFQRK